MCSKWSMLSEGEDDWSFISYTLSCIMHKIQDVLSLPQDLAVRYRITMQNTRSEFLVTVSISLSKWEPGMLQNSRVPDSGMMDFWIPSRPFYKHMHDSGKVSKNLRSQYPLIQNGIGNIGFFQNIRSKLRNREFFWRIKNEVDGKQGKLLLFH